MATNRKLQKEVDLVLKRVNEGVDNFDRTHEKLSAATTTSLRDKFEQELKKEIKKLQRCRDSIKTWLAGSEIKDKAELLKFRKLVESKMEQYKTVERESKMKAYSKEALKKHKQKKAFDKETQRSIDWLKDVISQLTDQLSDVKDEYDELDEETDDDEQERLEEIMEKHRKYIDNLETTLELLKSGTVVNVDVEDIKVGIEYYIEDSQNPEFVEDELIFDKIMEKKEGTYDGADEENPLGLEQGNTSSDDDDDNASENSTSDIPTIPVQVPSLSINAGIKVEPKKEEKKKKVKKSQKSVSASTSQPVQTNSKSSTQSSKTAPQPTISYRDMMLKSQQKERALKEESSNVVNPPQTSSSQTSSSQISSSKGIPKLPEIRVISTDRKLHQSFRCLPSELDCEKPHSYIPKNPTSTPSFFPQEPLMQFNDPAFFELLENDTWFFAFYFQKGRYQQNLAAQALRSKTWRFHTKYLAWFKRHSAPKETGTAYEVGTYLYFDYDTEWCIRKKDHFKFEYAYLEDPPAGIEAKSY